MYCSLDEAFQSNVAPERDATATAPRRSSKKRRANMPVPEPFVVDPDRPANRPMPPSEHVGGGAGNGKYQGMLNALENDESFFPHPNSDQQGADGAYQLEPDWSAQFRGPEVPSWIKERIAAKDAEVPLKPAVAPWMDAQPTLWQKIPTAFAGAEKAAAPDLSESRIAALEARLEERIERMFAKLEDLDRGRSESNHMEVILFILGGFFLLLMLDMLVKQGLRASVMLAAAGGGGATMHGGALNGMLKQLVRF